MIRYSELNIGFMMVVARLYLMAGGMAMRDAVSEAKALVLKAIKGSLKIGHGHGPVNILVNLNNVRRDK